MLIFLKMHFQRNRLKSGSLTELSVKGLVMHMKLNLAEAHLCIRRFKTEDIFNVEKEHGAKHKCNVFFVGFVFAKKNFCLLFYTVC